MRLGWGSVLLRALGVSHHQGLIASRAQLRDFKSYIGDFYARRARRIFPVYFLYVGIAVAASYALPSFRQGRHSAIWLVTYTYNVYRGIWNPPIFASLIPHLWSLSLEEQFYIGWPFLVFFASRKRLTSYIAAVILAAPILRYALVLAIGDYAAYPVYYLTPSQMDGFALGGLLAAVGLDRLRRVRPYLLAATALAVLAAAVHFRNQPGLGLMWPLYARPAVALYTLIDLVGACLVMECVTGSAVARVLDVRPLRFLGRVSYGFYLFHVMLLAWLYRHFDPHQAAYDVRLLMFVPFVLVTLGVSALSFYSFERRFLKRPARKELTSVSD